MGNFLFKKGVVFAIIILFVGVSVIPTVTRNVSADDTTIHHQDVWNVDMNGQGNSITISPGASITISLEYEIWNRIGCPACIAQIVIGIDHEPKYCAYHGIPGTYPGVTGSDTHTVQAPLTAGVYDLNFAGSRSYSCAEAMSKYFVIDPLTKIGTIIVSGDGESVDYTILWQVDLPKGSDYSHYQADSGDMDGDGKDEIAFIPYDHRTGSLGDLDPLTVVDDNGITLWSTLLFKEECHIGVEDYDLDGKSEIFVGASNKNAPNADAHIWAFEGDGALIWEFIDTDDYGNYMIPAGGFVFKNIDGDPELEIIASNGGCGNKNNYALDQDGTLIWRYDIQQRCHAILGDLNGDGDEEVILLTPAGRSVYVLNPYDGSIIWQQGLVNYNRGAVGDLTGDGIDDLFVISKAQDVPPHDDKIYAIRNDGMILWNQDINDDYIWFPILQEINDDGKLDVVLAENNRIFALDSAGSLLWETYYDHDVYQLYRFDADCDGDYEIVFFANKAVHTVSKDGEVTKIFDLDVTDNWRIIVNYHGRVTSEKSRLSTYLVSPDTNGNGIKEFLIEEVFSDHVRISVIEPNTEEYVDPFGITWLLPEIEYNGETYLETTWMGSYDICLLSENQDSIPNDFDYGLIYQWLNDVPGKKINASLNNEVYYWDIQLDSIESGVTELYDFNVTIHWDWIKPWGVENIVVIILTILPGVGQYASAYTAAKIAFLSQAYMGNIATYTNNVLLALEPLDGFHPYVDIEYEGLGHSQDGTPFTIRSLPSPEKVGLYLASLGLMIPAGIISLTPTPVSWIFEVGLILVSQAMYIAAYDPDLNYDEIVNPSFIYPGELENIEDINTREVMCDLYTAVGYFEAFKDSFIKYQGALQDGNTYWASVHQAASNTYLTEGTQLLKSLPSFFNEHIAPPTQEQINIMRENFSLIGLPLVEQSILAQFGWTQDEINQLGSDFATIPDEVYYETSQIPNLLGDAISLLEYLPEVNIELPDGALLTNIGIYPDVISTLNSFQTITCYVEFPGIDDLTGYQINTAFLNNLIEPISISSPGDYDGDGIDDITIEYDIEDVIQLLGECDQLIFISGDVTLPSGETVIHSGATLIHIDRIIPEISAKFTQIDVEEDEGLFEINFEAIDNCDPNPSITGVMLTPTTIASSNLELTVDDDIKIEFELEDDGGQLVITEVKGPDPEALWQEIQDYGGIIVDDDDQVYIELDGDVEYKIENGVLKIEGHPPILRIIATDSAENLSEVTVQPMFGDDE